MSLKLYDAARVIANPFAYAEHREKVVSEKLEKMADSRIRAKKGALPKVNKALAEKIMRAEEREERKKEKKEKIAKAKEKENEDAMDVDEPREKLKKSKKEAAKDKEATSVLSDPRFKELFENPEFQVDQTSREFALLNPAAVAEGSGSSSAVRRHSPLFLYGCRV